MGTSSQDVALAIAAYQSDGKVVAVGHTTVDSTSDIVIARYNVDGSLDGTFGNAGKQTINFADADAVARGVAVDSLGRIIVSGSYDQASSADFIVARLTSTGMLDLNFGTSGMQSIDFGGRADANSGVAVDSEDRVVVAGSSYVAGFVADFAIARLTSTGALDDSFAVGGKRLIDLGSDSDFAMEVAVDAEDRVVVGGYMFQSETSWDFAVVRLTSTGILDQSFGSDGTQTVDFGGTSDHAKGVAIDAEGRVLLAGNTESETGRDFAVARLTGEGVLDTNFATDGKQTIDFGSWFDHCMSVAVDSHGRIVVAGDSIQTVTMADFAVARLTGSGEVDSGFGTAGKQIVDFTGMFDSGQGVAIDSEDRVVVVGISNQPETQTDFGLVRLLAGDPPVPDDLQVSIDIKPGSEANPVNPRSRGITKVAILSTASFDAATEVAPETLTFGRTGEELSLARWNKLGTPRVDVEDVDGDGLLDLLVAFKTSEAEFQAGDDEGLLRGQTVDGRSIAGRDAVRIVDAPGLLPAINDMHHSRGETLSRLPSRVEIGRTSFFTSGKGRRLPSNAPNASSHLNGHVRPVTADQDAETESWANLADAVHALDGDPLNAMLAQQ